MCFLGDLVEMKQHLRLSLTHSSEALEGSFMPRGFYPDLIVV